MCRYPQIIEAVSKHISPIEQDAAIRFNEDELTKHHNPLRIKV